MNLIECIDYFKENYISFYLDSNNIHMSINTQKNNVDISNEHSENHICISEKTNTKGYKKVSKYLQENINELVKESEE